MDIFVQKKWLVRLVIPLILLNLATISIFFWKGFFRNPPEANKPEKKEVTAILQKELNLTDKQMVQVKDLRTTYFEKEKAIETRIREERDSMNADMFNETTDENAVKALAKRVADNEYNMELLRFEQAKEFKAICTGIQLKKFDNLVKEIRDFFKPDDKQKRK
jgi:Spy/CpxP family protein refolding chaperone